MKNLKLIVISIIGVMTLAACDNGSSTSPQSVTNCPGVTAAAASQVPNTNSGQQSGQPCSLQALSLQLAQAQASGQIPGLTGTTNPLTGVNNSALNQVGTPSIGIASIQPSQTNINDLVKAQSVRVQQALANLNAQSVQPESAAPSGSSDRSPSSVGAPVVDSSIIGGGGGQEVPGGATR